VGLRVVENRYPSIFRRLRKLGLCYFPRTVLASARTDPSIVLLVNCRKRIDPVALAAATFGPQWAGNVVEFVVDNAAVVEVINSTYCDESHMMHLMCLLVFYAAKFNFWFKAVHIPGKKNTIADTLSRNKISLFFSQVPYASSLPVHLPSALLDLVSQDRTWISTTWMTLFEDFTQQACQNHHTRHTK